MSNLKICPGCNWKFPRSFNKNKCRFCGTAFNHKFCTECGELKSTSEFVATKSACKVCSNKRNIAYDKARPEYRAARSAEHNARRRQRAEELMEQWCNNPELKFKPLSESEWYKACSYFGGCAICGNEHIETREFFMPFQSGGRYSPWNVFPMCGQCATYSRRQINPFVWLDSRIGGASHRLGITEECRQRLIDYFIGKVSEALETHKATDI